MADTPASTPPLQPQPVQSSKPVSEALLNDKVLHPHHILSNPPSAAEQQNKEEEA